MEAVLKGLLFGLFLSALIGPVFFALIQTSLEKGWQAAVFMAAGISLSDTFYLTISALGVEYLRGNPQLDFYLSLAGGIILMVFGILSFFKKVRRLPLNPVVATSNKVRILIKGMALNGANPFVLLFWIGLMIKVNVDYDFTQNQLLVFAVTIIATVFGLDLAKSYLAARIRHVFTPRIFLIFNRTVGVALFLFSIRLFYYAFHG